jgi:hypothetical protein
MRHQYVRIALASLLAFVFTLALQGTASTQTPVSPFGSSGKSQTTGAKTETTQAPASAMFSGPVNVTGTWTDDYGDVFTLTQSGFTISGTVANTDVNCASHLWPVSGSVAGDTFTLTATNPLAGEQNCSSWFTLVMTLVSCGSASGTWSNSFGESGSITMTTTCCQGCPQPNPAYYQFGFLLDPAQDVPNFFGVCPTGAACPTTAPWPKGNTIALCSTQAFGCALSSTATMLTTFPFFPNPPAPPATQYASPDFLNYTLDNLNPPGYGMGTISGTCDSNGTNCQEDECELSFPRIPAVITSAAQNAGAPDVIQLIDGGGQILTWSDPSCDPTLTSIDCYLETHVCQYGDRVVLALQECINKSSCGFNPTNPSHYVFVTGISADGPTDWNVFDPGWQGVTCLDGSQNCLSTLGGHLNGFTTLSGNTLSFVVADARTFRDSASQSSGALYVTANSPVELLLTDPLGRTLGYSNGADVFDIPLASYFRDFPVADDTGTGTVNGDPTGIKNAYVPSPVGGTYSVGVTGTGLGTYTLRFGTVTAGNNSQTTTVSGVAGTGSTTSYQVTYSPTPGSIASVTLTATFASTLADIGNCLALGLIKESAVAKVLSGQIDLASHAAAQGNKLLEKVLLTAFRGLVNLLASKLGGRLLTGVAPQVLLADANSLLSQLH